MKRLLEQKRIFLVGGPGGVGKTTLAAALGIQCASMGYKTVVLTVDPARRLAHALGFDNFKQELQPIAVDGPTTGSLHATMLDTQRYFDRVIDRFATTPQQKEKILANPIYRVMVDSLGGTHEYAAMERLLEFASDPQWQRIVVDTPPTQNAVDLLSAPQRLADFMDNSVLKWFQGSKPLYLSIFQKGTKVAMKLLQKIFGAEFLERFASLMDDLEGMQAGFRNRNLEVIRLLQSLETAFLLVTYPSELRHLECSTFKQTLLEQKISLSGVILNRIEPRVPEMPTSLPVLSHADAEQLRLLVAYRQGVRAEHQLWGEKIAALFSEIPTWQVERHQGTLHDVQSLSKLGRLLVS